MGMLTDRVAVITGGASGLGRAMAERFVREGARVVIGDLAPTDELVAELGGEAGAVGVRADVTQASDHAALVSAALDRFGALDIYINNAGITRDASMRKMTEEQFDQVIAVHLRGAWLGTKAAGEVMSERGSGSIVNISSMSGKSGNFGQTNYSAAKAGIVGLTKAAAKELARKNVRVNAIQPGLIRTAMTEAMPAEVFAEMAAAVPMQRPGEPDEVAKVAQFLASDLSSYLTGTVTEVSGGRGM